MINESRYRILAIGKIRKHWIKDGIDLYLKRLPDLKITELRDDTLDREAKAILATIKNNEKMIAMAEEGQTVNSHEFAQLLDKLGSQRLVFVIGGASGLSNDIKRLSSLRLSLSDMTFPHELARLMLIEQIYRAKEILKGGPYQRS